MVEYSTLNKSNRNYDDLDNVINEILSQNHGASKKNGLSIIENIENDNNESVTSTDNENGNIYNAVCINQPHSNDISNLDNIINEISPSNCGNIYQIKDSYKHSTSNINDI